MIQSSIPNFSQYLVIEDVLPLTAKIQFLIVIMSLASSFMQTSYWSSTVNPVDREGGLNSVDDTTP